MNSTSSKYFDLLRALVNSDLCIRDPISIRTREVFINCQSDLPNKNCIFFQLKYREGITKTKISKAFD